MADLGITNAHVNRYRGSSSGSRQAVGHMTDRRHRLQTLFYAVLFAVAFLFVVAVVCGIVS